MRFERGEQGVRGVSGLRARVLNQYDPVTTATTPQTGQRLEYDLDGNLIEAYVTGDINGDGRVDLSDLGILLNAKMVPKPRKSADVP